MVNVDRPNGFRPVKTMSGAPWYGAIRSLGVADGADIFVGDPVSLSSGLAAISATNDTAFLGVAVGFGKINSFSQTTSDPFNAADLTTRFYDDSANTHTDWVVFYVPVDDVIFEAQTATALTKLVGETMDIVTPGAGSVTTGISGAEITTSTNADVTVIEIPKYPDNDSTLVWGRYWVMFTRAEQAFHA